MPERIVSLLVCYYGVSPETAAELVTELRDLRSLEDLTRPRAHVAATPPPTQV